MFATNPREAPGTVSWREAVPVGHTDLTQEEVHTLVQRMGQQYKGNRCGAARVIGPYTVCSSRPAAPAGRGRLLRTVLGPVGCVQACSTRGASMQAPAAGVPPALISPCSAPLAAPCTLRYHLLQMNCNHFSSDLCERMTGQPAPQWINRLASIAVSLHCLLPTGWVPPLRPPTAAMLTAPESAEEEQRRLLSPLEHPGSSESPPRSTPQLIS